MATRPTYPTSPITTSQAISTAVTMPLARPARRSRRPSLARDVFRGAVRGDFARDLGLAGALTQVALGYCPGIGTLCASRDLLADLRHRDGLGALLNGLALFPIFGGFTKTIAVLHHTHQIGRAMTKAARPPRMSHSSHADNPSAYQR